MRAGTWIEKNLKIVSVAENRVEGCIVFPAEFELFAGHFPGNPTLPGICELACAETLLKKVLNRDIFLKQIGKAKFFAPVGPGEMLEIKLEWQESEASVELSAVLTSGERKIAKFQSCVYLK